MVNGSLDFPEPDKRWLQSGEEWDAAPDMQAGLPTG